VNSDTFGKKRFAANLTANSVAFLLNILIGFFLSPYIVGKLGKEAYGFVSLGMNFTLYISLFTTALNSFAGRYIMIELHQDRPEGAQKYFNSVFFGNLYLIGLLLIPCGLLILFLKRIINISNALLPDVQLLWMMLFLALLVDLLSSTYKTSTFVRNRLDLSAITDATSNLLRVLLLFLLFTALKPSVWIIGFTTLVCTFYQFALNISFKRRLMPELKTHKKHFDFEAVKILCAKGIWNSINQLSAILLVGLDLLIANLLINATEMSYLSIAKIIPTYLQSFMLMICTMFTPALTAAYANDDINKMVNNEHFAIKFVSFLCIVPLMGLIIFGADFLTLWMKPLTHIEVQKVQVLLILTILPMIVSIFVQPLTSINTVTTKVKTPVIVTGLIGVLNIGIVYLLLKTTDLGIYAIAGVSSILLVLRYLFFVPMYAAHNLKLPLRTFYKTIIRGLICSLIIFAYMYIIHSIVSINTWIELIGVAIIAGLSAECIVLFSIFNKQERGQAWQTIKQKFGVIRHENRNS